MDAARLCFVVLVHRLVVSGMENLVGLATYVRADSLCLRPAASGMFNPAELAVSVLGRAAVISHSQEQKAIFVFFFPHACRFPC